MSNISSLRSEEYRLEQNIEWLEAVLAHIDEYPAQLAAKRAKLQEVRNKIQEEEAKLAEEAALYASSDDDWQALDEEARLTGQRLRERRTARRF